MDMLIAGRWNSGKARTEVRNPYSGEILDTVPRASAAEIDLALKAAQDGARVMAGLPAYRRAELLEVAATTVEQRASELAKLISSEQGKPSGEAQAEAGRIAPLLRYCAGEALRRSGEVVAMDSAVAGVGRLGFTLPEPCGIVVAITPFNYPALLVCHKIGPALAAGNAVILKPAETTPLTALFLASCLLEAGIPDQALQCITGPGSEVGPALCSSDLVRKISFTGSVAVGNAISRSAGAKRLTCELGSISAVIVLADADPAHAAHEIVRSGYYNAGQVCISAQRVVVERSRHDDLVEGIIRGVDALRPGDPTSPETTIGPVITKTEAVRIVSRIESACRDGASVVRGGESADAFVAPTVVLDVPSDSSLWAEELFGPAVGVRSADSLTEAIESVNETGFGLAMSVFTQDIDRALGFARHIKSGMVHVNSGPLFRTDSMPFGGVGKSGFGKEGVRYAMDEMTEQKLIVVHPGMNAQ